MFQSANRLPGLTTLALSALGLTLSASGEARAADAKPGVAASAPQATAAACPVVLDHSFPRLQDGKPQNLCQYAGRVLLVVNTASYCGYTPQYQGLEQLHERLAARGLTVLGFPTNDFGKQEPGTNAEVADFCFNTYGVKFPMLAKTTVQGPEANPFIATLAQATGSPPKWNFHKYLIGRDGRTITAWPSSTKPDDPKLLAEIEKLL